MLHILAIDSESNALPHVWVCVNCGEEEGTIHSCPFKEGQVVDKHDFLMRLVKEPTRATNDA